MWGRNEQSLQTIESLRKKNKGLRDERKMLKKALADSHIEITTLRYKIDRMCQGGYIIKLPWRNKKK